MCRSLVALYLLHKLEKEEKKYLLFRLKQTKEASGKIWKLNTTQPSGTGKAMKCVTSQFSGQCASTLLVVTAIMRAQGEAIG